MGQDQWMGRWGQCQDQWAGRRKAWVKDLGHYQDNWVGHWSLKSWPAVLPCKQIGRGGIHVVIKVHFVDPLVAA